MSARETLVRNISNTTLLALPHERGGTARHVRRSARVIGGPHRVERWVDIPYMAGNFCGWMTGYPSIIR